VFPDLSNKFTTGHYSLLLMVTEVIQGMHVKKDSIVPQYFKTG